MGGSGFFVAGHQLLFESAKAPALATLRSPPRGRSGGTHGPGRCDERSTECQATQEGVLDRQSAGGPFRVRPEDEAADEQGHCQGERGKESTTAR